MNDIVNNPPPPANNESSQPTQAVVPEIDYDKLAGAIAKHNSQTPPLAAQPATPAITDTTPAATPNTDLVSQLTDVLDQRQLAADNEAMQLVFDQQFDQIKQSTPGFEDFLKGNDDYGRGRMDQINQIPDVKQRLTTLRTLQQSFAEASANVPGRQPIVNTREQQLATDMQGKYDDLYAKLDRGEFTNLNQFSEEHARLMAEEADMLRR